MKSEVPQREVTGGSTIFDRDGAIRALNEAATFSKAPVGTRGVLGDLLIKFDPPEVAEGSCTVLIQSSAEYRDLEFEIDLRGSTVWIRASRP
jgi:hypothetical protein